MRTRSIGEGNVFSCACSSVRRRSLHHDAVDRQVGLVRQETPQEGPARKGR